MNVKELKRQLDPKARYEWVKDTPYSWRLINAFTMKTIYGCEDRLTAVAMTRRLRSMKFVVSTPPGEIA